MLKILNKKFRIKLRKYEYELLNSSRDSIINTLNRRNDMIRGPIALPPKREIYCVFGSPDVVRDSKEYFEISIK